MPRFSPWAALTAAIAALLVGTPATHASKPPGTPACIQARPQARYVGFAYDHVVHIHNGCQPDAACSVTTNVNPEPVHARIPSGERRSVLTFRASPSRQFTYELRCTLEESGR